MGVRLPAPVARAARLNVDQRVHITVEDGRVVIAPHGERPLTLVERLALFDTALRGGEAMLVLSPGVFNARTGLVIGLSMTSAAYNATNPVELAVGSAGGRKAGATRHVLCHQPKSFDWRTWSAKPHAHGRLTDLAFAQACAVLNQIIAIEQLGLER